MKKNFNIVSLVLCLFVLASLVIFKNSYHRERVLMDAWFIVNSDISIFHRLDELEESLLKSSDAEKDDVYKKIVEEKHEIKVVQGVILSATDKEISDLVKLYDKN